MFTLSGVITSAAVGASLGLIGSVVLPHQDRRVAAAIGLAVGLAVARDRGLINLRMPSSTRQTNGAWSSRYGGTRAALLWGADLGSTFRTRLTFSGAWSLVVVAFMSADPGFGAAAFSLYWLGRALSVWLMPLTCGADMTAPTLIGRVNERQATLRRIHLSGLMIILVSIGITGFTGIDLRIVFP